MTKRSMSEISYMFDMWVCRDKKNNVLCFENKPTLINEEWADLLGGIMVTLPPEIAYNSESKEYTTSLIKAIQGDYKIYSNKVRCGYQRMSAIWG